MGFDRRYTGKHVVFLVGVGEVDYLEGNAQMLGDEQGIVGIVHPGGRVTESSIQLRMKTMTS